jgi:cytidylate kinase
VIIAIDGPAGSGKSTTARAVAERLGFHHLDSGAFYRALTWAAMRHGHAVEHWAMLRPEQLDALGVRSEPAGRGFRMLVDGADVSDAIRQQDVTANVSAMARVPAVRDWLLDTLRAAARGTDLVADGRDIGTVVFPDAELKVFLVADPRARAERRLRQLKQGTAAEEVEAEMQRIAERDRIDETREVAPLRPAADAVVIDTTELSFEQQVGAIIDEAQRRLQAGTATPGERLQAPGSGGSTD